MQIFKRDTSGAIRVWSMVQDGSRYRTISGIRGGNMVISGWTQCVGKQKRTDEEQAAFEVASGYEHKLSREYHESLGDVDTPKFFKPMLAHKYEVFPLSGCYSQPKLDGVRCIATAAGLFSREGKPILGAPHVHAALHARAFYNNPHLILDGELYNHDLKDDFNKIVSMVKKQSPTAVELKISESLVQYHIYDLPSSTDTFGKRSEQLRKAVMPDEHLHLVETEFASNSSTLDTLYGQYLEDGYEGQMVRLHQPYEQKRSKTLLKRKEFQDAEFECVEINEGLGNWAGLAKRVTCRLPDGRTFGAGIKGNQSRAKELLNEDHKVVTVQFFALTPDGIPRFPVVTKFHGEARGH